MTNRIKDSCVPGFLVRVLGSDAVPLTLLIRLAMMISTVMVGKLLVSPAESNGPLGGFCKSQKVNLARGWGKKITPFR